MTIREYNGKFRCIEKYKGLDGKWHSATVTISKNTTQTRREAHRTLEMIISEKITPKTEMTLKRLLNDWIAYQKTVCKMSTWTRNEATGTRLVDILDNPNLSDLTAGYIRSCLLKHTQNPGTLNEYIARLKALIRWGYQNDYLRDTICIDKLQRFKDDRKARIADKYLERDELKAVIASSSAFYGSVISFMALSGLRVGEAIALLDKDVQKDVIIVNKTYDARNHETTTPKTAESIREVHIQPELREVIKTIRANSKNYKLRNPEHYQNFILNPLGEPLSYDKFNREFGRITKEVTGKKLTTHALRHTHASLLAEAGIPLETISRRLGHADSDITKEIYLHVTEKMKDRDNELLEAVQML